MTDQNTFTRREFVSTGLVLVSTITSVPAFLKNSAVVLAAPAGGAGPGNRPGVPEERILVVVQLSGGNDGLNAVVPFGMPEYYRARPALSVKDNTVLKLDATQGIGLNPALADFKSMLDDGQAAIIQGVGYPNPNRSHFASMDIWHTADPVRGSARGEGWLGRGLDLVAVDKQGHAQAEACVCIGNSAPLATQGARVKPVTFERADAFRWAGGDLHPALTSAYDRLNRTPLEREVPLHDQSQVPFVLRTALDAQVASDRIRAAVAKGPATPFPRSGLADQLKTVAAMIRAELPTRVYYVALGGFDTHANQAGRQDGLLSQLGAALKAFYAELAALGQEQRVLTMCFSEFGRRVEQNASQGTDHGTAGPMFLAGPMVRPGLHGAHPSLERTQLDGGDLKYHTDFRCVYAAILDQWLKADSKAVLGSAFKPAEVLKGTS
ncbi:MAG: DUF1501 domain-containing protein [Phycisphaeraceae bacterium]